MKKALLLSGLAMALTLPLSSFKTEAKTTSKFNFKELSSKLVVKKKFTEVEFGDVPGGPGAVYGIFGTSGTTTITSVRSVYTGNPPLSYSITYWDGALISISGINEYGVYFEYSGHLVWG